MNHHTTDPLILKLGKLTNITIDYRVLARSFSHEPCLF